jgi:hypothetical protein
MNQVSTVAFGPDATVFSGYAESAGDRLGALDFQFENTGPNAAYIRLMAYDGQTAPSGYAYVGAAEYVAAGDPFAYFLGFKVVPGGTVTKHATLLSKRVAFFGSGNTTVNITPVLRNKADLRGAQIDIVATGRRSWGYDEGWDKKELKKKWGTVPGPANTVSNINAGSGQPIDSTQEGV